MDCLHGGQAITKVKIEIITSREAHMSLAELLSALRSEGFDVRPATVTRWVWSGRLPRPQLDGSGRYRYGHEQLRAVRELLKTPPRRGRPPRASASG